MKLISLDLYRTIYIILFLEGLAVHWWTAIDVLPLGWSRVFYDGMKRLWKESVVYCIRAVFLSQGSTDPRVLTLYLRVCELSIYFYAALL
jgi:hypothetical protein